MTSIPFILFWFQSLLLPCSLQLAANPGVDYRPYQSEVRSLPMGPKSPAYAVCDMMETFTGVPLHLDAEALRAHEHERGDAGGAVTTFYQYLLERKGLLREDSTMTAANQDSFIHYHCPAGSVLSLVDASKVSSPGKIVSLLKEGIKGIVVTYAYCPKEWKVASEVIRLKKKNHRPKGHHTVLVVGYEDSTFIFKNSWGESWGENGYGRMSFAYHESHAREGLIAYLAEAAEPASNKTCATIVKLQPEVLDGQAYIQASLVGSGMGKMREFTQMEYLFHIKDHEDVVKKVLFMATAKSTGFPCLIPLPSKEAEFHWRANLETADGIDLKFSSSAYPSKGWYPSETDLGF
jgi:hypothetical protein